MNGRPRLRRAAAGVLLISAILLLTHAGAGHDVTPSGVRPTSLTITQRVAALRAMLSSAAPRPAQRQALEVVPLGRQSVNLPILMYHYVRFNPVASDTVGYNLSVTPPDFAAQMDWLAHNGYHPVDFDDVRAYFAGMYELPSRPIVLTFDDGYRDLYSTAYPILKAHHFKAVSYVIQGFLNSPASITEQQLLEMDANGIEIGAHTVSHADLTKLGASDLHHEIFDSKSSLEAILGHPVLDFCYPSGKYNNAVVQAVEDAGYDTATTTQTGVNRSPGNRFLWPRVRVSGGESLDQFVANIGQPEATQVITRAVITAAPRGQIPLTYPLHAPRAPRQPPQPLEGPIP